MFKILVSQPWSDGSPFQIFWDKKLTQKDGKQYKSKVNAELVCIKNREKFPGWEFTVVPADHKILS